MDRPSRLPPTVSVILPTYNRATLLPRAVHSVLAQTRQDFELIIVDDASTDGTAELVEQLADSRIVYLRQSARRGAAAARNTGIRAATAPYVAFIDSDDAWLPTKLERQLSAMSHSAQDSSRTIHYTQSIKDDGVRRVIRPRRGKRPNESVASYVFGANLDINTIVVLMPTKLALEMEFLESSRNHEEVDLFIRLESAGAHFEFLPEPLSIYYCERRPDRISVSVDLAPSLDWHKSVASYFTPKATRGFRAKIIAPRLAANGYKSRAVGIVLTALATASIRLDDALKYLAEIVLTDEMRTRVKTAVAHLSKRSVQDGPARR